MDKTAITCVLLDDHVMVLEAISALLERHERIRLVGAVPSVEELLSLLQRTKPDVLIADISLPGRGIFDADADIRALCPDLRRMVLSGFLADIFVDRALKQGYTGYLMKGEPFGQLLDGIQQVAARNWAFSRQVVERLNFDTEQNRYSVRYESDLSSLTARQLEVLRFLACGQSVKEISLAMNLSQKSVDSHKYRIMNKLGIHDRVLLARFAIREGLMIP